MRYFRSNDAVYESVRSQLNAAYGYPNVERKTETAIPPAAECPHDDGGRVYLAMPGTYCDYILPSELLGELLASGAVEELTHAEWLTVFPEEPPIGG